MATKNSPGEFDCYAAAGDDEPLFVLRSTDPSAPELVRLWAEKYELTKSVANSTGQGPGPLTPRQRRKVDEALQCAEDMERWRRESMANGGG